MIAHLWSGGPGDAFLVMDPASGISPDGTLVSTKYNDFDNLRWLGAKRGEIALFDETHTGEWFCVEAHAKLNTPGASDGVFEFWINDELQAGTYNLNWHGSWNSDPANFKINAVFFENYWNAGSPISQERYFDNIIISTQRIGCGCAPSDQDQDGIPDEVEAASGVYRIGVDDRLVDTDQDGQTNTDEFLAGTDPSDPRSRLEIRSVELTEGLLTFCFGSVTGRDYSVEQADALRDLIWEEVPLAMLPGNVGATCFDLIRPAGVSTFYRLKLR